MQRASYTAQPIGATRGHAGQGPTEVTAYRLVAGALVASVWSYGATLVELLVPDRDGARVNVVRPRGTSLADHDRADRGGYAGATVGRYANRIAGGRFRLGAAEHVLATNNGRNHLHGGEIGFDQYVWGSSARVDGDAVVVDLHHHSPDGDEGYPGALDVTTSYRLDEHGLTIRHDATSDAPTIVNLTNHAYWNLAGTGTIEGHQLELDASGYVPVDDTQIPVDGVAPVAGTRFDFTTPAVIGDRLDDGGVDHSFAIDHTPGRPAATLLDPASGRRMRVSTDQPAVQIYTGEHFFEPRAGLCMETQCHPDTPNRPWLGSALLGPGEAYRHTVRHDFDIV